MTESCLIPLKKTAAHRAVKNLTTRWAAISFQSLFEKNGFWQSDRYSKDASRPPIGKAFY